MSPKNESFLDKIEGFVDDEEDVPRKTLADQIRESKELKELEYRKQLEASNSSYKLDEKSLEYYNQLREQERAKEKLQKEREQNELSKFRLKKAQAQTQTKSPSNVQKKPLGQEKLRVSKLPPKHVKKPILVAKAVESTMSPQIHSPNKDSPPESREVIENPPKNDRTPESSPKPTQTQRGLVLGYSSDSD